MNKIISDIIQSFESEVPNLQNQHNRLSLIGFLPIQANANYSKSDDKSSEFCWAQLLVSFMTKYPRVDETGQTTEDNKSLKTLVIKFPPKYLSDNNITVSMFTEFFEREYVGKKFLILPVTEEKQAFHTYGKQQVPTKNKTEVEIDPEFNLKAFMDSHKKK